MNHETVITIEGVDIDVTYEILENNYYNHIDIIGLEIGGQNVFDLIDIHISKIELLIYEKLEHNAVN